MGRIIFFLYPFFVASLIKRFKAQFEPNGDGSWDYLPEYISKSYTLTDMDYKTYVNRFINSIVFNAVLGSVFLLLLVFWILYFRESMSYFMWGIAVILIYYHGTYYNVYHAFYSPENKSKYHWLYGFLFPTIFALILIANYFDWSIDKEDTNALIKSISDRIGLTPYVKAYPYISFGLLFSLFFIIRMFYGVHSSNYRPASKRRRRQIKEERNAPPKEKPWDKSLREAKEKEKLSKKQKKRRKKEFKKQGKVFPKKYKGNTDSK